MLLGSVLDLFRNKYYLVVIFLLFLGTSFILPVVFEEVDDPLMLYILSGRYTGDPSGYAVFLLYPLGYILAQLYAYMPGVEWYSWYLWFGILSSFFMIYRLLRVLPVSLFVRILMMVTTCLFFFRVYLFWQFSIVASLYMIAGVSVLLRGLLLNKIRFVMYFQFLLFATCGFMLRYESAILVLIVFIPLFVYLAVRKGYCRVMMVSVMMLAVICTSLYLMHTFAYSTHPGWRAFMELQKDRFYFHGYALFDAYQFTDSELNNVGWSRNDYWLFKHWLYSDALYSTSAIVALAQQVWRNFSFVESVKILPSVVVKDVFTLTGLPFYLLFMTVWCYIAALSRWKVVLMYGVWSIVIILLLCIGGRFPERVLLPLTYSSVLVVAVLSSFVQKTSINQRFRHLHGIPVIIMFVVICFLNPLYVAQNMSNRNTYIHLRTSISQDLPSFTLVVPVVLPIHWDNPFKPISPFPPGKVIWGSWLQQTPHDQLILQNLAVKDLYTGYEDAKDFSVISYDVLVQNYQVFLKQHRQVDVEIVKVKDLEFYGVGQYRMFSLPICNSRTFQCE